MNTSNISNFVVGLIAIICSWVLLVLAVIDERYGLLGILALLMIVAFFYLLRLQRYNITKFSRSGVASRVFLIVSIAGIICLNAIMLITKHYSVHQFLASILLCISAYPLWRYLKRQETSIPFVPLIALLYGLHYGVFVFLPFERYYRFINVSHQAITQSLLLTNAGLVVLLVTFYKWPRKVWQGLIPQLSMHWSEPKARTFAVFLGIIGFNIVMLTSLITVPQRVAALVHFLIQLNILAIAILFFLQLNEKLRLSHKLFLWVILVPLRLMMYIGTGLLFPLIRFGLMFGLLYILVRRSVPWRAIIIFVVMGLFLFGARDSFRSQTWQDNTTIMGNPVQKGIRFLMVTDSILTRSDADFIYLRAEALMQRIDMNSLFAYVVEKTPSEIPYWGGETYSTILWRFVPRILVPDKPQELGTAIFPDRYGLRGPRDVLTAVRLPQLIEMYANFGVFGVIAGMFVLGLVFQVLQHVLDHQGAGEWVQVSSVIIFSSILDIGGNFTMVYGSVIYWIALLWILGLFVQRKGYNRTPLNLFSKT